MYSATKAAVDAVTKSLSKELGPRKIRVNAINPGMVETEGTHSAGIIESDFQKQVESQTPPRAHRATRRYRLGSSLPGLVRFRLVDRRNDRHRRRISLSNARVFPPADNGVEFPAVQAAGGEVAPIGAKTGGRNLGRRGATSP